MPNAVSTVEVSSTTSGYKASSGNSTTSVVEVVTSTSTSIPVRRIGNMEHSLEVIPAYSGYATHSWWLAQYLYRRKVRLQSPEGESVPSGHPVIVDIHPKVLNHGRKVREDFEDIEVIHVVGAQLYVLYREVQQKLDGTIQVAFELQEEIPKNSTSEEAYYIYHGNLELIDPPLRPLRNGELPLLAPVGWKLADFDDSEWTFPTIANPSSISTDNWPDTPAVKYDPPNNLAFYRRWMAPDYSGPARMYLVAEVDTEVQVFLDGELVLQKQTDQVGIFDKSIPYEGNQQLAISVSGGGSWAWQWLKNSDGSGTPIRRTYDPFIDFNVEHPWTTDESGVIPEESLELATPSATPDIVAGLFPADDETSVFNLDPWPVVISNTADRISYTRPGEHWQGGSSNTDNARATVLLYARHVRIMSDTGRNRGIMEVQIDGAEWEDVDLYSDIPGVASVFEAYDLSDDLHELRVRVAGRSNESATETTVNIAALEYFKSLRPTDAGEDVVGLFWKTSFGGES